MTDTTAMYHRTLMAPGPIPVNGFKVKSYLFTLLKSNDNAEITTILKSDKNFADYATDFEKDFSILVNHSRKVLPVVDVIATGARVPGRPSGYIAYDYPVVGHVGWFAGGDICAREDVKIDLANLPEKEPVIVRHNAPRETLKNRGAGAGMG